MSRQLSIHVVFDSDARTLHVEDAQSMPVDSKAWVWDDEFSEWQTPTDDDIDAYSKAASVLAWLFDGQTLFDDFEEFEKFDPDS